MRLNQEGAIKRFLHHQVKLLGLVLVLCHNIYLRWCGYMWGPRVSFVMTRVLIEGHQIRIRAPVRVTLARILPLWFMPHFWLNRMVLLSVHEADNFESHNSLKLNFTNVRGFRSNYIGCESFLESNSLDILALGKANLEESIDFSNSSVMGYLSLNWKDAVNHVHGTFFCTWIILRKDLRLWEYLKMVPAENKP